MSEIRRAIELKAQFGDNAKYVVSEIMDEIKQFENSSHSTAYITQKRLEYYMRVKSELEKL